MGQTESEYFRFPTLFVQLFHSVLYSALAGANFAGDRGDQKPGVHVDETKRSEENPDSSKLSQ